MSKKIALVIEQASTLNAVEASNLKDPTTVIRLERECQGCQACVHSGWQQIEIQGEFTDQVELQLSLRHQMFALFHSLLLPLLFALLSAFVADWLQFSEIYGIILTICGFILGTWLCRQLQSSALTAREI